MPQTHTHTLFSYFENSRDVFARQSPQCLQFSIIATKSRYASTCTVITPDFVKPFTQGTGMSNDILGAQTNIS